MDLANVRKNSQTGFSFRSAVIFIRFVLYGSGNARFVMELSGFFEILAFATRDEDQPRA